MAALQCWRVGCEKGLQHGLCKARAWSGARPLQRPPAARARQCAGSPCTEQQQDEARQAASPPSRLTHWRTAHPAGARGHAHAEAAAAALAVTLLHVDPSLALQIEPANALSLPTWAIHVSSVAEWVIAMGLVWRYAEVSGNARWKGLTWGMVPALGSAMAACTWHFFYNSPQLEWLVALQAFLTLVGNTTCLIAAYRIWDAARLEPRS